MDMIGKIYLNQVHPGDTVLFKNDRAEAEIEIVLISDAGTVKYKVIKCIKNPAYFCPGENNQTDPCNLYFLPKTPCS